jgi:hypothetical protein
MPSKKSSNVNSTSKRVVLEICGTTGERQCTVSILSPNQSISIGSTESHFPRQILNIIHQSL